MLDLTSPNGGEVWQSGSTYNITWNCTGCAPTVNINLTVDGGMSWNTIASGVPNTGSYSWTIPAMFSPPSANCLIQVTDGMLVDQSMSFFQISHPSMTVVAPNGGETLISGQTYTITVSSTNSFGGSLDYSTNGGTSWNNITASLSGFPGTVNYTWTVPAITPAYSANCLIRFNSGGPYADFSDSYFTITNTIDVTSPNGGEVLPALGSHTITWNNTAGITSVLIQYSTDNGSTWNLINPMAPTGPSGGSYVWNPIPATPSATCLVRVMDGMIPFIGDTSDATFTITSGTATVTAPNGGETWYVGTTQNITWTYTGPPSQYDIEYSTDNGATWNLVATNVSVGSFGGSYAWTIPNTPSTQCLVRVTDMIDPTRTDVSNAVFTIASPTITVVSPNGGESWLVGSTQTISWNSVGPITQVMLEYSSDGGTTWNLIAAPVPNGTGGGTYSWTVPATPSATCLVRVSDFMIPTIVDQSDAVFTISANVPRSLTVVAPNGGESFTPGSTTNISWTFTGGVNQILIEYTTDNGTNWSTIATMPVTSSSYSWTIPNTPSNQCLVRITDVDSSYVMDMSDAHFEIQSLGMNSLYEVSVKVYPNPVTDFLFIQNNIDTPVQAEVYSLDGKLIYQAELLQVNTTIPMQAYKPGIYLVRIQNKVFKVTK